MNSIINAALGRSRTVVLFLIAILVAGFLTYRGIPKESEPDIEIPIIYISLHHDGISPEDAERLLVRPVEQEVRVIEGIKEITASAYEGGGYVQLEFDAGASTDEALQDVREKVDAAKAELPDETDEPTVTEVKLSKFDPMLVLNIAGDLPERALFALTRDLKEKIENLTGVLEVNVVGTREELLEVIVDPLAMESYGFTQSELFQLVDRNNRLVAAGSLQTGQGRFPVKVPGVFESVADILSLPVKVDGDRVVRFSDVATVRRTYKDPESYARLNGRPAVGLEVVQRSGANVIETIDEVKALIAKERQIWPEGVNFFYSRDKSVDIRDMLTDLQNNVLSAVLLVFIVIIGILGVRSAALVGIAIPGSFLASILILGAAGISINIVVLFALIMAVGMLVDGAIVVTELADRRMAEGIDRREAYAGAARRMAWPIIASTATTLAAFAPLAFWPGMSGEFMKYLPITLITTLSASLVMALLIVPTLGGIFGKPGAVSAKARHDLAAAEVGDLHSIGGITGRYVRFLSGTLQRPGVSVLVVLTIIAAIYTAYGLFGKGTEFFPDVDPDFASVDIRARGDLSTDEKDIIVSQVERRILGMPELESVYAKTGNTGRGGASDLIGSVRLNFVNWKQRRPVNEILEEVRSNTSDIAGIVLEARKPDSGPQSGKPIVIEVAARNQSILESTAERIRAEMDSMEGLRNIEDSRPLPGIEWKMQVDRSQAARFGADVSLVGSTIQLITNGLKLGEYRPDDAEEEIDIRVRYPYEYRNLSEIDKLRVASDQGVVPISNFVQRLPEQKVSSIERTDLRRTITLQADVAPGTLVSSMVAELTERLPNLGLDPRAEITFKGGDEDEKEAAEFLQRAMLIALAVMAMILVTQFNSLFQTLLILTAVVLSTGGVMLGHLIMGKPFGIIMSGVGVIALAGIVVNNNIVFIDTYNVLRQQGMAPDEAVLRTCAVRFRPVMLTTVTTILGLMPMVLGVNINLIDRVVSIGGPSSQWWTQLASAVAGGLAFATILTLLLTPSFLQIQANISKRMQARKAAGSRLEHSAA